MGAAVTGLIAFALFLAGGLLLWANGHYKDADGYLSTGSQRFASQRVRDHDAEPRGRRRRARLPAQGRPLRHDPPADDGQGRQAAVRRRRPHPRRRAWLRGVAHSEVADIDYAPVQRPLRRSTAARASPAAPAAQTHLGRPRGAHALHWNVAVRRLVGRRHERRRLARRRRRRQRGREGAVHRRDRLRHARPRPAVRHRHRRADRLRHAPGARRTPRRWPSAPARRRPPATTRARRAEARSPAGGGRTPAARRTGRPPAAGRRRRSGRPRAATSAPGSSRRVRSCSIDLEAERAPSGAAGRRRSGCQGRIDVTDGRLRGRRARALLGPDRAGAPAPHQLAELDRDLLADEHVQLVAVLDDRRPARRDRALAADDHVQQRLARQPELAHRVADDRVVGAHRELHRLGAEPVQQHRLDQRRRDRGLVGGDAQPARDRLDRQPLQHGREQHDEERDLEDQVRRAGCPRSRGRSRTRSGSRRAGPPSRASAARAA